MRIKQKSLFRLKKEEVNECEERILILFCLILLRTQQEATYAAQLNVFAFSDDLTKRNEIE